MAPAAADISTVEHGPLASSRDSARASAREPRLSSRACSSSPLSAGAGLGLTGSGSLGALRSKSAGSLGFGSLGGASSDFGATRMSTAESWTSGMSTASAASSLRSLGRPRLATWVEHGPARGHGRREGELSSRDRSNYRVSMLANDRLNKQSFKTDFVYMRQLYV
eukprot:TRINITY_DN27917_c0_g1_i1.p1 TRINITY_DN27917_c0_g1~~TRINITY_DN27917_c0_g1_i1.p1  ORF type:complete len:166 (+),score=21.80 TRINITY_DN27917_c0_g1_i1:58-555(+)